MHPRIFVATLALLAAGCNGGFIFISSTMPATFTMKPAQTATVQGVAVTFQQVVSDSRCPINAVCVWAGEATIEVTVRGRGPEARYQLQLTPLDPAKRTVTHRDIVLEFQALQPLPVAGQPTDRDSYRATIEIR